MRVACCQLDIVWEDEVANVLRVEKLLALSRPAPGTLLLLPEMWATGFSMNTNAVAGTMEGRAARLLWAMAKELDVYVLGGVALTRDGGRPRNEALLFGPDGNLQCRYAKVHPFSPGGEDRHYDAGESAVTCTIGDWNVQPAICYDLRFPELFRLPKSRPELICVIANWPIMRDHHWTALLKARAIENQAYVAGVNRCGRDPNFEYSGRSQIISPMGEVLADAGNEENIISAELDLESLRSYRAKLPFLDDAKL